MTLIYTGESATIDRHILKPEDFSHCPDCTGCRNPLGHCGSDLCQPGDLPLQPEDACSCCCGQCHYSEAETCTSTDDHKTCVNHRHMEEE